MHLHVNQLLLEFIAAMGRPQCRRRVIIFASLFCNVRDVLLAQDSSACTGACREEFGDQHPCFHCFRDTGELPRVEAQEGLVVEEAEAEAELLGADDPRSYAMAVELGESRCVAVCKSSAQVTRWE